jgi:ABC-2 type transport system permease protein
MTALLHAELVKLRTTRTFIALTGVAVLTSLVLVGLVARFTDPAEAPTVLTDVFSADTSSLFILILAVVGISGEWRHRTIAGSLLAVPHRVRFLAAKTLAFAAAGLVMSLIISISIAIVGATILSLRDVPLPSIGEIAGQIGRNAAIAAMLGAFGVAIAALVRNQVVAIVGVLIACLVIEPTLLAFAFADDWARFGPFVALPSIVQGIPPEGFGLSDTEPLSPWLSALAMLAWIGVAFAAAAALLRRRDLQ